jgi:hypothetical protein
MHNATVCPKQVERFLMIMQAFTPESRRSFQKIYRLAPSGSSPQARGKHVRVAMMEAVRHPQIAYWVRVNLAVRVRLKLARVTNRPGQVERLTALLEAFHIAADAFVLNLSIEQAALERGERGERATWRRTQISGGQEPLPFPVRAEAVGEWISPDELAQIQAFKHTIIPGFVGAVRRRPAWD